MPAPNTEQRAITVESIEACHAKKDGHPYWKILGKDKVAYITNNGQTASKFEVGKTYNVNVVPGNKPDSAVLYSMASESRGEHAAPAPAFHAAPVAADSSDTKAILKKALKDMAKALDDAANSL